MVSVAWHISWLRHGSTYGGTGMAIGHTAYAAHDERQFAIFVMCSRVLKNMTIEPKWVTHFMAVI